MERQEILLESGTNELELLTFLLANQSFGLNVLKVQHNEELDCRLSPEDEPVG